VLATGGTALPPAGPGRATGGALPGEVMKVHANYHVPISNTASGLLCMEAV